MGNCNTLHQNGYQYRSDILKCIEDRLNHMINSHCKVLTVRLDIRFPHDMTCDNHNSCISTLMGKMKEYYNYHRIAFTSVWAREQNASVNHHYHVVLFMNGSKLDNGWSVRNQAGYFWSQIIGNNCDACVHLCPSYEGYPGILIRRPSSKADQTQLAVETQQFEITKNASLHWASYLAKTATKGSAPPGVREFQGSQI